MALVDPALLEVLETGDIELRFNDDRSIKVHSQKLKMASMKGGILRHIIDDLVEDQIVSRRRYTDQTEREVHISESSDLPYIKVRTEEGLGCLNAACMHIYSTRRCTVTCD